jgi:Protein of unknown function (DUF3106)
VTQVKVKREKAGSVTRGNYMTRWLAVACMAAAIAVPLPSFAGAFGFRGAQQQRRPLYQAQRPAQARPRAQQGHAGDWLRRYKDMPAGEQERELQKDPQFRNLSPPQQQQLRERLQHFSNMQPQEQLRVLNRMETWEHLTPEQKQQARQIFGQMQQLPPGRRGMVRTAVRDLAAMPPQQREQVINSERFKGMFSEQERDMMREASRLPLAPPEGEVGP